MSQRLSARLFRGDLTKHWKGPTPVTDGIGGPVIGHVVSVSFDGSYTVGEIELDSGHVLVKPSDYGVGPVTGIATATYCAASGMDHVWVTRKKVLLCARCGRTPVQIRDGK